MTFEAGRFVLASIDDAYVTSWDTWEECKVAWPEDGHMSPGYKLVDGETGRIWWPGARYEWEDAQT